MVRELYFTKAFTFDFTFHSAKNEGVMQIFTVYQGTLRLMPLNQLRVLRLNGIRRTSEALQILVDEGLNGSMNPKFLARSFHEKRRIRF
jgi:hypothetical protein